MLTTDLIAQINQGALITSFASEDHVEVAEEYYSTKTAVIIVDWMQTVDEAPELKSAVGKGTTTVEDIVTLKDAFASSTPSAGKRYTIFRSHGTPMQDLAAMQLILRTT